MFDVKLSPKAVKELQALALKDQKRVVKSLVGLSADPFVGKKLKGKFRPYYSLRIWPYRIIYAVQKKELLVIVIRIGPRKDVYK